MHVVIHNILAKFSVRDDEKEREVEYINTMQALLIYALYVSACNHSNATLLQVKMDDSEPSWNDWVYHRLRMGHLQDKDRSNPDEARLKDPERDGI